MGRRTILAITAPLHGCLRRSDRQDRWQGARAMASIRSRPAKPSAIWGMSGDICMRLIVLPGDGIGPEISDATIQVLDVLNRRLSLGLTFETHEIGLSRLKRDGSTF